MNNEDKLDKWDILFIRHLKDFGSSVKHFKNIWAHRCGIELKYSNLGEIENYLVYLVQKLELANIPDFVSAILDSENGRISNFGGQGNHILNACCHFLRNTTADQIPDYIAPLRFRLNFQKNKVIQKKTVEQWLKENLTLIQFRNAKKYKSVFWNHDAGCLSTAIAIGFDWGYMPEGFDYWGNKCDKLDSQGE